MKMPKTVYIPMWLAGSFLFVIAAALVLTGSMCAYQGYLDRNLANSLTGVIAFGIGFKFFYTLLK